jgi:peptidylprolyl isomerase
MGEAYGPRNEQLVVEVTRDGIPDDVQPKVGEILQVRQPDGQEHHVMVTATSDESLTLDANHPLAGKDLTFEIQLVEIG